MPISASVNSVCVDPILLASAAGLGARPQRLVERECVRV